jgi:hypothetical protein
MPRSEELQKATLNLRTGDMDFLAEVYRPNGIAASLVIRRLVSAHVDQLRRREGPTRIDLGELS